MVNDKNKFMALTVLVAFKI